MQWKYVPTCSPHFQLNKCTHSRAVILYCYCSFSLIFSLLSTVMTSTLPRLLTGWQQTNLQPSTTPAAPPSKTKSPSTSDITSSMSTSAPPSLQRSWVSSQQQPADLRFVKILPVWSLLIMLSARRWMITCSGTLQHTSVARVNCEEWARHVIKINVLFFLHNYMSGH